MRMVLSMNDDLAGDLRALGDSAAVRPLDVRALRRTLTRRKRRRNLAGGLAVLLAAAMAVPAVQGLRALNGQDRLASGPNELPAYLLIVVEDETLRNEGRLPTEAESCLPDEAAPERYGLGQNITLTGPAQEQQAILNCLESVDGVQVFRKPGPEHKPVYQRGTGPGQGPSLTQEQATRAGVDATEECSAPGVRESAPPFEGEPPLDAPTLIAAYLTDQRGYAQWDFEYNGSVSLGGTPTGDGLVRLCWYQQGPETQLVVSTVGGSGVGSVPNSNLRSTKPVPVLAPPAPRNLSVEEVQRRSVVFPQPEGVVVRP